MPEALDYATAFRTVGRLLDVERAGRIWIDEQPEAILLNWRDADGATKQAEYPWEELQLLDEIERVNRGLDRSRQLRPAEGWSELLRTIGQELDLEGAELSCLIGDWVGLSVTWSGDSGPQERQYSSTELWNISKRRAQERQSDI